MQKWTDLLPNSLRFWIISLILLIGTFLGYYKYLYPIFLSRFEETYVTSVYAASEAILGDDISISIRYPTYIAGTDFVKREFLVRVENRSLDDQYFNMSVLGKVDVNESQQKANIPLPANFPYLRISPCDNQNVPTCEDLGSSFISVIVPARSIKYVVYYVGLESIGDFVPEKATAELFINNTSVVLDSRIEMKYGIFQSFGQSSIKFLLFPPTSNIFFIPLVLLVVSAIAQRKNSCLVNFFNRKLLQFTAQLETNHGKSRFDLKNFQNDIADILSWLLSAFFFILLLGITFCAFMLQSRLLSVVFTVIFGVTLFFLLLETKEKNIPVPGKCAKCGALLTLPEVCSSCKRDAPSPKSL